MLTGYRLHASRLNFTGGEATRSIKYPLIAQKPGYAGIVIEAIKHDSLRVRGPLNLNDYLENPDIYTLADFWVDSLRSGVVWMPNTKELEKLVKLTSIGTNPAIGIFRNANPELTNVFDEDKFTNEFILKQEIRATNKATPDSVRNKLRRCVKAALITDDGQRTKEATHVIDEIINSLYSVDGQLKLKGNEQEVFWKERFGLDKGSKEVPAKDSLKGLSFYVIPELIAFSEELQSLIEQRTRWLELKGNPTDTKTILGIHASFNAFSNYFNATLKALQTDPDKVLEALWLVHQPTRSEDVTAQRRSVEYLSDKAQRLGNPKMTNSWDDYRSNFGGKLQSWYSNFEKRDAEIAEQTKPLHDGAVMLKNDLAEFTPAGDNAGQVNETINSINLLLDRLIIVLESNQGLQGNTFHILLASVKSEFNQFWQRNWKDDPIHNPTDKKGNSAEDVTQTKYKGLYRRIYKPVSFFGSMQRRKNEKVANDTYPILKEGLMLFQKIRARYFDQIQASIQDPEVLSLTYRKLLDKLWSKWAQGIIQSEHYKQAVLALLQSQSTDPNIWKVATTVSDPTMYAFYNSDYSRTNKRVFPAIENPTNSTILDVIHKLYELQNVANIATLTQNTTLLLDYIEIEKLLISQLMQYLPPDITIDFRELKLTLFENAYEFIETFDIKEASRDEARYILNTLIFSELRGAASVISQNRYVAKYDVQMIGSDSKFPLLLHFKETIDSKLLTFSKTLFANPHRWLLSIPNLSVKNQITKTDSGNLLHMDKTSQHFVKVKDTEAFNQGLFQISSSKYQIQFLEKILRQTNEWENIQPLTLSEWSLIAEEQYAITWNPVTHKPELSPISETQKLFVSIPFNVKSKILKDQSAIASIRENQEAAPFLGIDVGEYGLGWVLSTFNDGVNNIWDMGFILDPNIRNIQKQFHKLQQRARSGTFNEKDSTLVRVRENAIGRLRNQIHDLMIHSHSTVIYEASISNFETGSGKVTKIYDSVKRSDVNPENKAAKAIHNHIWGGKSKYPGKHFSAFGSSYTCTNCGHSLFELTLADLPATVIDRIPNMNIIKIQAGNKIFYGYSEKRQKDNQTGSEHKVGYTFPRTMDGLKSLLRVIKDFARPPLLNKKDDGYSSIIGYINANWLSQRLSIQQLKGIRSKRGNSSIFVCPFEGCRHVADADIQAAFIMALRGYLHIINRADEESDKAKINAFEESCKYLQNKPAPIGLSVNERHD